MAGRPPIPHVDGVEHRDVLVDGIRVHVAEAGDGPPLVLQHGFPQHWWEWRHQIGPLAERYRVICPDLRGFGWSEAPPDEDYTKERLADDLLALLGAMGVDRFRYVGHDWGGWIGFLLGIHHSEAVERMVIAGVPHPWLPPNPRRAALLWYQGPIAGPTPRPLKAGFFEQILRRGYTGFSEEEVETFMAPLRQPAQVRAATLLYRQFLVREMPSIIRGRFDESTLDVPTLLLYGRQDMLFDEDLVTSYQDNAPRAEHVVIDEAGHFVADEAPDAVLERVRDFMS